MPNVRISDLPPAVTLDGTELVEITQLGFSRKTTISAVQSPAEFQATFVAVTSNPDLPNERTLAVSGGLTLNDGGPGGPITIGIPVNFGNPFATPLGILADIVTATPPTTELVTGKLEIRDNDDTDLLADLGFVGSSTLRFRNRMHGGLISIQTENAAGTDVVVLEANPDGDTDLYALGSRKLNLDSSAAAFLGTENVATPPVSSTISGGFEVRDADFTDLLASFGFIGSPGLSIINRFHGGSVSMFGENDAGTLTSLLVADPDTDVKLYNAGVEVARTLAAASGGLAANNTLTGAGFERVLTVSDGFGGILLADINTATPPTTELVTANFQIFDLAENDKLFSMGFNASPELEFKNFFESGLGIAFSWSMLDAIAAEKTFMEMSRVDTSVNLYFNNELKLKTGTGGIVIENFTTRGGNIVSQTGAGTKAFQIGSGAGVGPLYFEDSFNNNSVTFNHSQSTPGDTVAQAWDPLNGVKLYRTGNVRLNTQSDGVEIWGSVAAAATPTTEAVTGKVRFMDSPGDTQVGFVGHNGNNTLLLKNEMHGGAVQIQGENAATGAARVLFSADPDTLSAIHHGASNAAVARTLTPATGGWEVDNQLTGGGFERVLTLSDSVLKVKTAIESVNTSITNQDDDHLVGFNLVAGAYYAFEMMVSFTQRGGDLRMRWTFTNAPQVSDASAHASDNVGTDLTGDGANGDITTDGAIILNVVGEATVHSAIIRGMFQANATTGGTMKLQWAQNTSDVDNTDLHPGTWMRLTRIQ